MKDHDIFYKMSAQIGELNGTLRTFIESQQKTNDALFKLLDGHNSRIADLEEHKNKLIGEAKSHAGIVAMVVSIVIALLGKLFR